MGAWRCLVCHVLPIACLYDAISFLFEPDCSCASPGISHARSQLVCQLCLKSATAHLFCGNFFHCSRSAVIVRQYCILDCRAPPVLNLCHKLHLNCFHSHLTPPSRCSDHCVRRKSKKPISYEDVSYSGCTTIISMRGWRHSPWNSRAPWSMSEGTGGTTWRVRQVLHMKQCSGSV
jgi:hypothetical protein